MDEYLSFCAAYEGQEEKAKLDNPAFHIHSSLVPEVNFNLSYSLLLNLASACNPDSVDVLWGFINKYQEGLNAQNAPLLAKMVENAINYYNDFIKANKEFKAPSEDEKNALNNLAAALENADAYLDASGLQSLVFSVGKENGYADNIRDWFLALYQILLGQNQGPRLGSFIALFGVDNFVSLIKEKVS
jgi:lysyl-tRNA synthetase class 1